MKVYKRGSAPTGAVYIGRGSNWGNPYIIGRDGTRSDVIEKFKVYMDVRLQLEPDWLEDLRGKDLWCFCAPRACHGDVILQYLSEE